MNNMWLTESAFADQNGSSEFDTNWKNDMSEKVGRFSAIYG